MVKKSTNASKKQSGNINYTSQFKLGGAAKILQTGGISPNKNNYIEEYNELKSFVIKARNAIGKNDKNILSQLKLDKPYNSNDLSKDYQKLRKLANLSGNKSIIEEASTLFPHVGQQIRGTLNSMLGTNY